MRSDRHQNKGKNNTGFKRFTRFWAIFYLLSAAVFFGVLIYADVLTFEYLCIAGGILLVTVLLFFPALFFRNFKKSRKIISLILTTVLIAVYGVGIAYMNGTLDFFDNITAKKTQTEPFYVLAQADNGDYGENESALQGKTVQTYMTTERDYSEAKNLLSADMQTEYELSEELEELAAGLSDGTFETILVSDAHYTTMCSEISGFKEGSKIIYTVKVPVESRDIAKAVDVTKDSFSIYVSGLDTEGSIDVISRSDVNMIVTVNPKAHKVLLTSIPRDYYIELPGVGAKDKLTHTGNHGIEETVAAAEKLTGLDINYYVKVNYTTVTELVNAIGGIEVTSDYTFVTHGMGVYYEFYEGVNQLDGSRALAFARERKSFSDGDFQRNKNQQLVLEGILKKAMSSTTILTKYTDILDAAENCVEINMSQKDIKKLIKMQLDGMPSWDIKKQSIIGDIGSEACYMDGLNLYASVVIPDEESVIKAVDKIVAVMEAEKEE